MSLVLCFQELRELGDAVGVVSKGASSSVIQALPLARYIAVEDNGAAAKGKRGAFANTTEEPLVPFLKQIFSLQDQPAVC